MLHIMVVDDEAPIRDWLVYCIQKCEAASSVTSAVNGEEAYRRILEQKPNVVFTDIRMPGMDGLELMSKVRDILPFTVFIILTNYAEFSYAKQAISLGAREYILKSEMRSSDIQRIVAEIAATTAKIRSEKVHDVLQDGVVDLYEMYRNFEQPGAVAAFWQRQGLRPGQPYLAFCVANDSSLDLRRQMVALASASRAPFSAAAMVQEHLYLLLQCPEAEALRAACAGAEAVCASVTREQKKESPPKLYDLTTLQREANRAFGYTAKQTLDYAQSLYEKKLLTYPRTDSRFLTADMAETASAVLHLAAKVPPFDGCGEFFPDVSLLVNDKKVSDHHAIIPTLELEKGDLSALPVGERNLLLLVCRELLCAVAEPYVYEAVTTAFTCGGHTFTAKGRHILSEGWREIDHIFRASLKEQPEDEAEPAALPDFTEGQLFDQVEAAVTEHFTAPPKAYTEDTLLAAMETAGKEDMPEDAERKGLGTPATRAAILEKLVAAGFVERRGKSLIPTKAGINMVTVLPDTLTSPMLTAEWEQKLTAIARGEGDPAAFLAGISDMARELVKTYSHISEEGQKLFAPEREAVGLCPRCGKPVYEGKKNFYCSDRSCRFVLWKDDRFWTSRKKELTKKMAADLLKKGRTSVKGMWSEKKGAAYDAVVVLDDTGEKYVRFKLEFPKRKEGVNGKK